MAGAHNKHTPDGGVLETTEVWISDLINGKQRGSILNPMLLNTLSNKLPLTSFQPKLQKETSHLQYKEHNITFETVQTYMDYLHVCVEYTYSPLH
jgi:hypothetical protein